MYNMKEAIQPQFDYISLHFQFNCRPASQAKASMQFSLQSTTIRLKKDYIFVASRTQSASMSTVTVIKIENNS